MADELIGEINSKINAKDYVLSDDFYSRLDAEVSRLDEKSIRNLNYALVGGLSHFAANSLRTANELLKQVRKVVGVLRKKNSSDPVAHAHAFIPLVSALVILAKYNKAKSHELINEGLEMIRSVYQELGVIGLPPDVVFKNEAMIKMVVKCAELVFNAFIVTNHFDHSLVVVNLNMLAHLFELKRLPEDYYRHFSFLLKSFLVYILDEAPDSELIQKCIILMQAINLHMPVITDIEAMAKMGSGQLLPLIDNIADCCGDQDDVFSNGLAVYMEETVETISQEFAIEKAAVYFHLGCHYLKKINRSTEVCMHKDRILQVVCWLKKASVLSIKIPTLLKKVCTLLCCVHLLSSNVEPLQSCIPPSEVSTNQWAFFYHTKSFGYNFSKDFSSKWDEDKSCEYLPASADCLEQFVSKFFERIPDSTFVVMSIIGPMFTCLHGLVPEKDTEPWVILSRYDSEHDPTVALFPVQQAHTKHDNAEEYVKLHIVSNYSWRSLSLTKIAPEFVRLMEGASFRNYATKEDGRAWFQNLTYRDKWLKDLVRELELSFGIWKNLFVNNYSSCKSILKRTCHPQDRVTEENRFLLGLHMGLLREEITTRRKLRQEDPQPFTLILDPEIEVCLKF